MKLSYETFLVNDVLPDDLLDYDPDFSIKEFLSRKRSFLSKLAVEGSDLLYPDWLDAVCCENNLNPKVILVNLQKEQSLVTKKSKPPEKIMKRALGFGMTDSGDIEKYYGFAKQNIAAIKWYNKNISSASRKLSEGKKLSITVDAGLLKLTTATVNTYLLYKYTPWTGAPGSYYARKWGIHGVYLFWKLWKQWWRKDLKKYNHVDFS